MKERRREGQRKEGMCETACPRLPFLIYPSVFFPAGSSMAILSKRTMSCCGRMADFPFMRALRQLHVFLDRFIAHVLAA